MAAVLLVAARRGDAAYCLSPGCHTAISEKKELHGPVSLEYSAHGGCVVCHTPDGPSCSPEQGGSFKLAARGAALCLTCHAPSRSERHPKVISGCTVCHEPHGNESGPPFLREGFRLGSSSKTVPATAAPVPPRREIPPGTFAPARGSFRPPSPGRRSPETERRWGVRAEPSKDFMVRLNRRTIKRDLETPDRVVRRLMTPADRKTLGNYLEFQRNLEKKGRRPFRVRSWTSGETRVAYTVELLGHDRRPAPADLPSAEPLACFQTRITINLRRVDDPELRDVAHRIKALFCRRPDGSWQLDSTVSSALPAPGASDG